jgi:endonuclease YncB( thermonuclease family)
MATKLELMIALVLILSALEFPIAANGPAVKVCNYYPANASGKVTSVHSGDTFNVEGLGELKLADITCPDIETKEGQEAKSYTQSLILGKRIYLYYDERWRDENNPLEGVAFLYNLNGSVNASANINRILVDSDHAYIDNREGNGFNPQAWWSGEVNFYCIEMVSTE